MVGLVNHPMEEITAKANAYAVAFARQFAENVILGIAAGAPVAV